MATPPTELFTRRVAALNAGDGEALADLIHPDFVGDFPQSVERVHGLAGFRAQLENYPGGVAQAASDQPVLRVYGDEERWAITPNYTVVPLADPNEYTALTRARYPDGSHWWVVVLVTMRDGRIFRAESYFAPEFEPPEWRKGMVEILPRD